MARRNSEQKKVGRKSVGRRSSKKQNETIDISENPAQSVCQIVPEPDEQTHNRSQNPSPPLPQTSPHREIMPPKTKISIRRTRFAGGREPVDLSVSDSDYITVEEQRNDQGPSCLSSNHPSISNAAVIQSQVEIYEQIQSQRCLELEARQEVEQETRMELDVVGVPEEEDKAVPNHPVQNGESLAESDAVMSLETASGSVIPFNQALINTIREVIREELEANWEKKKEEKRERRRMRLEKRRRRREESGSESDSSARPRKQRSVETQTDECGNTPVSSLVDLQQDHSRICQDASPSSTAISEEPVEIATNKPAWQTFTEDGFKNCIHFIEIGEKCGAPWHEQTGKKE